MEEDVFGVRGLGYRLMSCMLADLTVGPNQDRLRGERVAISLNDPEQQMG